MTKYVVIDDEFFVRVSIKEVVKQAVSNYVCVGEAKNGIEGLALIKKAKPDLVLLDIKMPGKDGLELCNDIRREKIDVPVLIISGYPEFEYAKKAVEYSFVFGYLLKPVSSEELRQLLEITGNYDVVAKVIRHIDEHYYENLRLGDFAKENHISLGHLSFLLKRALGKKYTDYITEKRLNAACEKLCSTRQNIFNISQDVGFSEYNYFIKIFRKHYGITPTEYRKTQQNKVHTKEEM